MGEYIKINPSVSIYTVKRAQPPHGVILCGKEGNSACTGKKQLIP